MQTQRKQITDVVFSPWLQIDSLANKCLSAPTFTEQVWLWRRSTIVFGQWRAQKFFSGGGGSTNSVEDRENGDLGAVAP
jgi:hypothetical protein